MPKTSFVVTVSGAAATEAVVALDWESAINLDDDGSVKSSPDLGDEAVFIVNLPPGYQLDDVLVRSDCGGRHVEYGTVRRTVVEDVGFDQDNPVVSLGYWPYNTPVVDLYTVPAKKMQYTLSGRELKAAVNEELPVEGVVRYIIQCIQIVYTPPALLSLTTDMDIFKVRIDFRTSAA